MTLEPAFRVDRRIFPRDRASFLADLADRTRWNRGGLGNLVAPLPAVPGHPAPKVIIDVAAVRGPRPAAEVQRILRKSFWMKTVECFRLGAYQDQKLRGTTTLTLSISADGTIAQARIARTTLTIEEVPRCLRLRLRELTLPRSKGRSVATVDIQIGPGDEPAPPPSERIVAGDGELSPDTIRGVLEASRPTFEACYASALTYAPELWGRLGIRFHVTAPGKTDEAFEVESQFPDERVTLCVLRAARALRFPGPVGGDLRFIVPLRFWSDRSPVPSSPAP